VGGFPSLFYFERSSPRALPFLYPIGARVRVVPPFVGFSIRFLFFPPNSIMRQISLSSPCILFGLNIVISFFFFAFFFSLYKTRPCRLPFWKLLLIFSFLKSPPFPAIGAVDPVHPPIPSTGPLIFLFCLCATPRGICCLGPISFFLATRTGANPPARSRFARLLVRPFIFKDHQQGKRFSFLPVRVFSPRRGPHPFYLLFFPAFFFFFLR